MVGLFRIVIGWVSALVMLLIVRVVELLCFLLVA